jgi:exodeoxyribonuclease VII large subunit
MEDVTLSPVDFVALLNQTLEYAYPIVTIVGELANFRVSKNKWVYFDLKDEFASVKFFGTVYMLPGPLEDGMMLEVRGTPRLHPLYGFSVTAMSVQPVGEGSIKKAAALLMAKLDAEGLFDPARKRPLPYPPSRIGLITSKESAAYADFIKIANERWGGVAIDVYDVQVQGEPAIAQIVTAIEYFNQTAPTPDVLVITRGGGSAEDLAAFSTEQVTRAVAGSRVPTIVAIGHEIDSSLAELAADQRASTPSNAAQLLLPDRQAERRRLDDNIRTLHQVLRQVQANRMTKLAQDKQTLLHLLDRVLQDARHNIHMRTQLLSALSPTAALARGYALVSSNGKTLRSVNGVKPDTAITIRLKDGTLDGVITASK